LGVIKEHFAGAPQILIQFIVSIPALLIIITEFFFHTISKLLKTRTIAILGLVMYVVFGAGAFFAKSLGVLLVLRALLGVSVGLIMPLSTGLLSYYYPPEKQAGLMGLSAAMNQMGGVVATLLAGLLANIEWNYGFLVYLLGVLALVLVVLFLPNERLASKGSNLSMKTLLRFHPSVVGMLLVMICFFVFPTNFAIAAKGLANLSGNEITLIMVGLDVVAFLVGLCFGSMMGIFRRSMKYFSPILFFVGYGFMATASGPSVVVQLIIGCVLVGVANGVGVPYLNTIGSIKAGKDAATTVMPMLSAALYLGQFISPLIVTPLSNALFGPDDLTGCFKIASDFGLVFLLQVYLTRHFQSLPPKQKPTPKNLRGF
jgi:MFS family permease